MAYDTKTLFEKAKAIIAKDKSVVFVEDVVCELGISAPTFYLHFKVDSNDFNTIKDLLQNNKTKTKRKLRTQWQDVESSATVQIALYKLIANPDELERLNPPRQKEEETKQVKPIVEWTEDPKTENNKENE
jgi:hypothetical protein